MEKVCLVTGAKKGIGLAVSQKLASEGYQVVVLDQETITSNDKIVALKADITKEKDLLKVKDFIVKTYGRLDCLVCNAGIIPTPCGIDFHNLQLFRSHI